MTKQSPSTRLADRVPVQIVLYQAACVLGVVALASFVSIEAMNSAFAGGLAVAIPNAVLACMMGLVQSPMKVVMLSMVKLVLCGVCLAVSIMWYVTAPVPFFIAAAVVMVVPSIAAYLTQMVAKPQINGLH